MCGVIHITVTDSRCVSSGGEVCRCQAWYARPGQCGGKKVHWTVLSFESWSAPAPLSRRFYPVTWFLLLLSVHSCRISLFVSGLRLRAPVHISKSISRSEAQRTLSLCHDDKFAEPPRSECNAGKWSHRSCGGLWSTNEWASGCEEFSLHLFLLLWLLLLSVSYIFPFFF